MNEQAKSRYILLYGLDYEPDDDDPYPFRESARDFDDWMDMNE